MVTAERHSIETYRGLVRRALPAMVPAYALLLLPPNPGVRTGPFIATNACVLVLVALLLLGRRWDADGRHPTPFRLATTATAVAAIGLGIWAFEGREATLAPLFFVAVAFSAAMGGRVHLVFAWAAVVVAYALASLAAGGATGYVISSTIVVGAAAAALQVCVRFAVSRVAALAERNDLQRRIVAAAAHANDLATGLREMAPLAARLLGTEQLTAEIVDHAGQRRVVARAGVEASASAEEAGIASLDLGPTAERERVVLRVGLDGRPAREDLDIVCDLFTPLVARTRYVESLERLAASDSLTGVASRRELSRILARLQADATAHAIVMIDVNGFKQFNDSQGHVAGDSVLVRAGALLRDLGPGVTAARYGGDEFVLVIEGAGLGEAREIASRLAAAWTSAMPVGVSYGVAVWDGGESATSLIERADRALYGAKRDARPQAAAVVDPA